MLKEDDLYNRQVPGWLGDGDVNVLYRLARTVPPGGTIVEIGSMHGKSACSIASVATDALIYCFDFWPGNDIIASDEIIRLNTIERFTEYTSRYPNIIPNKVSSNLDYGWDKPQIDMFFIDAAHTNPTDWESIEYWLPHIKSGGVICGHDYYTVERSGTCHYPDIIENVSRLEKLLNKKVKLYYRSCIWSIIV
jgi:predicted O-methyltransferase YrrM